jgi:hypothetical protein
MKRYFLIIPLLLISFFFAFSSKTFACGCSANAIGTLTATNCPNNSTCSCTRGPSIGDAPTCTETPKEEQTDLGGDGQKCYDDNTCKSGLYCMNPGQSYEECMTEEERCNYSGIGCITPTPSGKNSIFCNGKDETGGIITALGCININSGDDLVTFILRIAMGVGGGIALALILYGVFIVTTSAGMPDKLKAGSEIITSAIVGLIFIILSVFLVNFIGINILGIPGL